MEEKNIYKKIKKERIDHYLSSIYTDYSRSYFKKIIDKNGILVNNKIVFSSYKLKYNDLITFNFNKKKPLFTSFIKPEKIEFDIIHEDDDIIAIDKQSNIVVHPSYGHCSGTLLNAVIGYFNGSCTPYLIHRLDKDTSGVIIFAKNEKSKIYISKQFQSRTVKKIYYAAVNGVVKESFGIIKAPLGRSRINRKIVTVNCFSKKMAVTKFETILRENKYTILKVRIITGRTHQIRSHMKYINHPIIGDQQYGGPKVIDGKRFNRQMLHAYSISFVHPKTMKVMKLISEIPVDMRWIFKNYNGFFL
ncbi:MAG: RluA family pseudouridine synthase [Endomicrobium sp.]|jgi:23S rRNA pseudouridine1911/1915/1917 synthase|nr:RluA family pseudouridine synthase [Endomicrobium sp.]